MSVRLQDAPSATRQSAVLIIGFGNDLRGDDGVGCKVAAHVERWHRAGVRAVSVAQLLPELAAQVAGSRRVVFVDACARGDEVTVTALTPRARAGDAHDLDPRGLLALAQEVYGACPPAWLVAIPGYRFEAPDMLSARTRRAMMASVCRVEGLLLDL